MEGRGPEEDAGSGSAARALLDATPLPPARYLWRRQDICREREGWEARTGRDGEGGPGTVNTLLTAMSRSGIGRSSYQTLRRRAEAAEHFGRVPRCAPLSFGVRCPCESDRRVGETTHTPGRNRWSALKRRASTRLPLDGTSSWGGSLAPRWGSPTSARSTSATGWGCMPRLTR